MTSSINSKISIKGLFKGISVLQWVAIVILILGVIWIIFGPMIIVSPSNGRNLDFRQTGQIGDTIGGITAPIIGLVSAILLYLSFSAQIKANKISQEESNFKYTLDEFEKIKSSFLSFEFIPLQPAHLEEYTLTGFYAISSLAKEVSININNVSSDNWRYNESITTVNYLLQSYSMFINEVSSLNLSADQRKIVQRKVWLYHSEYNLKHFQLIASWDIASPKKDEFSENAYNNRITAFSFKFLTLDIAYNLSEFKKAFDNKNTNL